MFFVKASIIYILIRFLDLLVVDDEPTLQPPSRIQDDEIESTNANTNDPSRESENKESMSHLSDKTKEKNHVFRWRSSKLPSGDYIFKEKGFTVPDMDYVETINLFQNVLEWRTHRTNSRTKKHLQFPETWKDNPSHQGGNWTIHHYSNIHVYFKTTCMSFILSKEMRYAPVADLMLRDRYKTIRSYLHVTDNTKKYLKTLKTQNKPYKVPSVIVHVKKIVAKLNQNSISR